MFLPVGSMELEAVQPKFNSLNKIGSAKTWEELTFEEPVRQEVIPVN